MQYLIWFCIGAIHVTVSSLRSGHHSPWSNGISIKTYLEEIWWWCLIESKFISKLSKTNRKIFRNLNRIFAQGEQGIAIFSHSVSAVNTCILVFHSKEQQGIRNVLTI